MDLPEEEKQLSQKEKLEKAQKLVSNNEYRNKRGTIMREVSGCLDQLLEKTKNRQQRANTIFSDMYLKLEIAIMILVILLLSICIIVRKLIVVPLVYYNPIFDSWKDKNGYKPSKHGLCSRFLFRNDMCYIMIFLI